MKLTTTILTLAALFLAVTAGATPLQIDSPSTVTITGRLMSPSGGWNWTIARAGVVTVKDGTGATIAEKIWNDYNSAAPETFAQRDTSVAGKTVSKLLSFTLTLDPGNYDWGAVGSYSQASAGYLWIDLTADVSPNTPTETWDWVFYSTSPTAWTEWAPNAATVPTGQAFTQTRSRCYDERKKEVSNLGGERNDQYIRTVTETETQTATGAKPKQVPVITWSRPDAITYGTHLSPAQLNATANVPGSFSYSPDVNTVLNAGNDQPLEVFFTPDDLDNYSSTSAAQTITVNKASTTLTILSPANPTTLPIDSAAALTVALKRDHDQASLSTASVTYSIAETQGTAAATLSLNQVTMTGGNGDDTLTIRAAFAGNANHLPSSASITFRVPVPGSVEVSAAAPIVSPITLPSAFLFSEHGATTSSFDFQVSNRGELPAEISSATFTAQLGSITSFTISDTDNKPATFPTTLAAGQTRTLRLTFRPVRYAMNRDGMKLSWRCRPNVSTVNSGQIDWTLEGQGLKPIMATIPKDSAPDPTNPRDLKATWPSLRSQ